MRIPKNVLYLSSNEDRRSHMRLVLNTHPDIHCETAGALPEVMELLKRSIWSEAYNRHGWTLILINAMVSRKGGRRIRKMILGAAPEMRVGILPEPQPSMATLLEIVREGVKVKCGPKKGSKRGNGTVAPHQTEHRPTAGGK